MHDTGTYSLQFFLKKKSNPGTYFSQQPLPTTSQGKGHQHLLHRQIMKFLESHKSVQWQTWGLDSSHGTPESVFLTYGIRPFQAMDAMDRRQVPRLQKAGLVNSCSPPARRGASGPGSERSSRAGPRIPVSNSIPGIISHALCGLKEYQYLYQMSAKFIHRIVSSFTLVGVCVCVC